MVKKNLVRLTIDTGGKDVDQIIATDGHPFFWLPEEGAWARAADLNPGQWLRTSSGARVSISAVSRWSEVERVHNLTVDDIHTYYVLAGATSVLVHNTGGCGDPLDEAREARDALAAEVGSSKATVTAGSDPATGRVAAGCNSNPDGCAEDDVARQLGIDPKKKIIYVEAIRPRTGKQVPICHRCQEKNLDPSQFPSGTLVKPGGAWDMEVVP